MITIGKAPPEMSEREIGEYMKIMQERYPDVRGGVLDIEIDREADGTECVDLLFCKSLHKMQHGFDVASAGRGQAHPFDCALYAKADWRTLLRAVYKFHIGLTLPLHRSFIYAETLPASE